MQNMYEDKRAEEKEIDELEEAAARAPFHPRLSSINDAGGPEWSWWEKAPGVFQAIVNGKRKYVVWLDGHWKSSMARVGDGKIIEPTAPCSYLWTILTELEKWDDDPQCVECRARSAEGPDYVCDRCQGDRMPSQEDAT